MDFVALWDFNDPAGTEGKFRELLPEIGDEKGELLTQIARCQGLQRRFDEAHKTLDEATPFCKPESRGWFRLKMERGRVWNSSGDKAKALPLFIEAYELGRRIGEDGLAVDAAHMVAIVEKGEEILRWNLLALELAESSSQPAARRWRKSLHNNLGWTYFDRLDFEKASFHFDKSREAAVELGDSDAARIARWSLAKVLRVSGHPAEALEIQQELLAVFESGYEHEEIAECLVALGRAEEAKPHFSKAYEALSQDPWLAEREPERLARLLSLT